MAELIKTTLGHSHWKTRAVEACRKDELMLPFLLAVLGLHDDHAGIIFADAAGDGLAHQARVVHHHHSIAVRVHVPFNGTEQIVVGRLGGFALRIVAVESPR